MSAGRLVEVGPGRWVDLSQVVSLHLASLRMEITYMMTVVAVMSGGAEIGLESCAEHDTETSESTAMLARWVERINGQTAEEDTP